MQIKMTDPTSQQPAELSKKALKKAAKEAEKQAKKAENKNKQAEAEASEVYVPPVLTTAQFRRLRFGDAPLHMSQPELSSFRKLTEIDKPLTHLIGRKIWVRARIHTVRATGKSAFLMLRGKMAILQACCFVPGKAENSTEKIDEYKAMIKYINSLPPESVVEIYGAVSSVDSPIKTASAEHRGYELQLERIYAISRAASQMPLQVDDAMRPDSVYQAPDSQYVHPGKDTKLDYRVIDLRTPANQAIMRVRSAIAHEFRSFLDNAGFIEINTPKIIAGTSEGGAAVFNVNYFNTKACLAQSPQLYKQMCISSGFGRVYEIGPVFRAENSHTHRHLCEFTGLDLEMEIYESYSEVLTLLGDLMKHIFKTVEAKCAKEISVIRAQYDLTVPEPLVWADETVIVNFCDGIQMLQEAGYEASPLDDLNTENERALGKLIKEKYNTDFYILDKFPLSARPFYTMPDPQDGRYSNSYDMFVRGEEICSGAQRVHNPELLEKQCRERNVDPESLKSYIDAFKYGCAPHGGAGLGLERIVMLMLGIENCRQTCLFPRTQERLTP